MNDSVDAREKTIQELLEQNTMLARNHLLLEQDFIECLDLLEGMVVQSCSVESTDGVTIKTCLDSMCLHSFADALRYLNSKGRVVVTSDVGRRVIALLKVNP
jgi:hypothetical protein